MASTRQYLDWHGQQWRVRVKVPARVRELLGRSKLVQPLHTADLKEAEARKWPVVSRLKAAITEAEKAIKAGDPLEAEALKLRLTKDDEETQYALDVRAESIAKKHGLQRAKGFHDLGSGRATLLDHHVEAFTAHKGYRQKSAGDFVRALEWLKTFLRDSQLLLTLESVDRKVAGRFITEALAVGRSPAKATAYLGFLRQYWAWLRDKGHIPYGPNPWVDQSLPAAPRIGRNAEHDAGKRPFTDAEVTKLLSGDGGTLLNDLMPIAALSGMRLEEICQLFISDCDNGVFNVWRGKTDSARRTVPIHSALTGIIERRTAGKQPGDYLFEELPPNPRSRETRSDPAAKRFTRYRREREVDERPNGKAKSNVDFHSFRRWFIRKVRDAKLGGATGFDEWTLTWVVGHTDSDRPRGLELSQHVYAGADPQKAKRLLVEAVRLPS